MVAKRLEKSPRSVFSVVIAGKGIVMAIFRASGSRVAAFPRLLRMGPREARLARIAS